MGATMMAAPTSNVAALVGPFFKDSPVLRDKRPIPRSYTMSALPPKADIVQYGRDVRFVPKADIETSFHSITWSASTRRLCGTSIPSALAVLRLMMSSNLVGSSTGMSLGLAPRRILSTSSAVRRNRPG